MICEIQSQSSPLSSPLHLEVKTETCEGPYGPGYYEYGKPLKVLSPPQKGEEEIIIIIIIIIIIRIKE
jgi:hypothetical protein